VSTETTTSSEGKTALSWTGHWKYRDYHEALGQDLILLPLPNFGHGIKTGMGSWGWGSQLRVQILPVRGHFLPNLMSANEIHRMTNINGAIPARKSVLAAIVPLQASTAHWMIFAQQLTSGAGVPRPATTRRYSRISKAYSESVSAIIAGQDVQLALSRAAAAVIKCIPRIIRDVLDVLIDRGGGATSMPVARPDRR